MNSVNKSIMKYQIRLLKKRLQKQVNTMEFHERTMRKIEEVEKIIDTDLEIVGMKMGLTKRKMF